MVYVVSKNKKENWKDKTDYKKAYFKWVLIIDSI